jgi:hypothetical protein
MSQKKTRLVLLLGYKLLAIEQELAVPMLFTSGLRCELQPNQITTIRHT